MPELPSVREMLKNIDELLEKGEIETADNMSRVASAQARISYAMAMETRGRVSLAKKDVNSAKSYFKMAIEILNKENAEEKNIANHIKEQLSKIA
ncbi:MAG: hypothetical protein WA063_03585 [Minisyncoccia bacterium]